MFKAKLNFKCNGITKKEGDILSSDDLNIIGRLLDGLIKNQLLEEISIDPKPFQKKKRATRKKVK